MSAHTDRLRGVFFSSIAAGALFACKDKGEDTEETSCFVPGTRVLTPRGPAPIESLSVGDEVLSYNLAERRLVTRRVVRLLQARASATLRLEAGGSVIAGVTAEHPFYDTTAGAFRRAEELSARSRLLLQIGEGSVDPVPVTRRTFVPGVVTVYNLTVEGPEHNYFAEGILVHNKSEEGGDYPTGEPAFSVEWGPDEMTLTITNGFGNYWFGMAQTGCDDPGNCWYGEDCVYGGDTDAYSYCHYADSTGVTLRYTSSLELDDFTETHLNADLADGVTYYVESANYDECWLWGHDISYYTSLGLEFCTEI